MALLSVQNVGKVYTSNNFTITALHDVSFTLERGEIFGLLGANGAGKSTLAAIIATLHPPTSGTILYEDRPIYDNVPRYRMSIGFCPQNSNVNQNLTIEQNLYFSGLAYRLTENDARIRSEELINMFNLTKYAREKPPTLSGGYKQRLLIARTLMHKPSLILLDEPTVGLDAHMRHDLWKIMKDLRDNGITIILTTHYMEEAEQLSDRVCVLDKGSVKLIGTPAVLKEQYAKNTLESVFIELTKEKDSL